MSQKGTEGESEAGATLRLLWEAPHRCRDLRAESMWVLTSSKSLENWLSPREAGNSAQSRS